MKRTIRDFLVKCVQWLQPKPDLQPLVKHLTESLESLASRDSDGRRAYIRKVATLMEARQMAGCGPWVTSPATIAATDRIIESATEAFQMRESGSIVSAGQFGDIELALQNVDWRREVNLSWLEFSRWGIQQIILVSRLHYMKQPIIRRLVNIVSAYVFGRGVELSSTDEGANEVLQDFLKRNRSVLGQVALVKNERRKFYDGNLFFAFFPDLVDKGTVDVRLIDATEIQDIITDPNDTAKIMYYRRIWGTRKLDPNTGQVISAHAEAYYPALGYEPTGADRLDRINNKPVMWDNPVLHRKSGEVASWLFGCPEIYPALNWSQAGEDFLEACATVKKALSSVAMTLTTKGGQQAMAGAKAQLQTQVGSGASLWDTNPPPAAGSIFASGPGTVLSAFNTKGAGGDPEEVRQFKLMCCMVVGVPETFLADVSTGNLATATTLDRPTEIAMLERQEAWREDLVTIGEYVLRVSTKAPSGKLRESLIKRKQKPEAVVIAEAGRILKGGKYVYAEAQPGGAVDVRCSFPAIREGDLAILTKALVDSMTLGNSQGQVVGIDEKEGVRRLYEVNGFENADELVEEMFPEGSYDPERDTESEDEPMPADPAKGRQEAARRAARELLEAVR